MYSMKELIVFPKGNNQLMSLVRRLDERAKKKKNFLQKRKKKRLREKKRNYLNCLISL